MSGAGPVDALSVSICAGVARRWQAVVAGSTVSYRIEWGGTGGFPVLAGRGLVLDDDAAVE